MGEEGNQIKNEIEGLPVSVIFDGTSRLGEALAVILRFVDRTTLTIHQRLIRMQLLSKSLAGEEVARELLSVLSTEFGVASNSLLAVMHDRAAVNAVAVRTLKVLYPFFLDIGCYLHTIDHVGDTTPILHEFGIRGSVCFPTATRPAYSGDLKLTSPSLCRLTVQHGGGVAGRCMISS